MLTFQSTSVAGCRPVWPGWLRSLAGPFGRSLRTSLPSTFSVWRGTASFGSESCLYKEEAVIRGIPKPEAQPSPRLDAGLHSAWLSGCKCLWLTTLTLRKPATAPARLVKLLGAVRKDPGSLRRDGLVKVATFSPCVSNFLNFWTVEGAPRLESGVCRHTPLE